MPPIVGTTCSPPRRRRAICKLAGNIDPKELANTPSRGDATSVTTVKEYSFKPTERLPEVKGTSAYTLNDNTVRFALNVWAGWGPIILANEGFKPGKVWKTPEGEEFKVELVLIDDPVEMRDAYATGDVQIGWATLDMVPLVRRWLREGRRQPHHAPHLSASRLVERRRRHRGPRGHQDRGRSARQETGDGAKFAFAIFRA